MSVSAVSNKLFCLCKCLVECHCLVHCKYRRKFLVSELLGDINGFYLTDQNLCSLRNIDACKFCDRVCALSYDLCVQCAIDDDCLSDFLDFVFL